ncbi:MAG: hypothetical protein J5590_10030 [Clostridia bacterium]|nr:hypothetical protein [Clostridia bacterium]
MEKDKFESMLILIVPNVVKLIVENYAVSEIEASDMFYNSAVYEKLEQEDTKLWHLSPLTLYNMFDEEQKLGSFVFPEEV